MTTSFLAIVGFLAMVGFLAIVFAGCRRKGNRELGIGHNSTAGAAIKAESEAAEQFVEGYKIGNKYRAKEDIAFRPVGVLRGAVGTLIESRPAALEIRLRFFIITGEVCSTDQQFHYGAGHDQCANLFYDVVVSVGTLNQYFDSV